ncbi:MAG TPA: DHA2 family efflux MFS transporter permease subunit [Actinomycetota bacterium]|jgi:EmrB/QacA subfamily drug resistance transporter
MSEELDDKRWWTLAVLCLSLVMVVVGNTVLNVALPTLVRDLEATSTELQWMVDSYALVFAGLLLTAGALGDRYGRKGALVGGLVLFGAASAVSAFATSATHLIITRAVMGVAAAFVMPATLSILTSVFPPHERGRAIGVWAGLAGAGAAIGPVAGGWLLEHFWWGSVFLLNVPIVIAALVAGYFLVPKSRDPHHVALDLVGAGLSIVGLSALLYGIIEAPTYGWSDPLTLSAFAVAVAFLVGFAWWERRVEHPMLDLRYFRDARFSAAGGAITLVFFAMFGTFFLLTQYLQIVLGYSALGAGLRTLPAAVTMGFAAPTAARLVERFGARVVVSSGLATVAVGLMILSAMGTDANYPLLVVALVVMALGMGSTMAPSTASIMSSIPMNKAGVGSAVNDTTRELGGALGVAVLGSIVVSQYGSALASKLHDLPPAIAAAASKSVGAAVQIGQEVGGPAGAAITRGARSAFVDAMGVALIVAAGVALTAAVLVGRYMPKRVADSQDPLSDAALQPAPSRAS